MQLSYLGISLKVLFLYIFILGLNISTFSQNTGGISGVIDNKSGHLENVSIVLKGTSYMTKTNDKGYFEIKNILPGKYKMVISILGYTKLTKDVIVQSNKMTTTSYKLTEEVNELDQIDIVAKPKKNYVERLAEIQGTTIYAGKKNSIIILSKSGADLAESNTRQLFSKVPGITAMELDGAGVQVSIASRGLNPHRSWEFNVNQNGFNINSDLFGYPEAHYNPAMEGVERIEIVKGSAALQYGPQFGGMLNYVIKSPDTSKVFSLESNQTTGSFGLFSSFNAIGGKSGKWTYYAYFDYRGSNGWRPYSRYDFFAGYASLHYQLSRKVDIGFEFSRMSYVIQFGGGLSDAQFAENPRQSLRQRNYFNPEITIPGLTLNANINDKTKLSIKSYIHTGQRNSVQILSSPLVADTFNTKIGSYNPRQVDRDYYLTFTTDVRMIHTYKLFNLDQAISGGLKYSHANTLRKQYGKGTTASDFDLSLIDPKWGIDLDFNTTNEAAFAENLFRVSSNWTITPGLRYDRINSTMDGNLPKFMINGKSYDAVRNIIMKGIGSEFKIIRNISLYGNYSDAYRPILYADLIPTSSLSEVDPNLKDAKGYNTDLGIRGKINNLVDFDISVFSLFYGNRIGNLTLSKEDGTSYSYRTNIGDAVTNGIESFIEFHPLNLSPGYHENDLSIFSSLSINDAKYNKGTIVVGKDNLSIVNKKVEDVPDYINRIGATFSNKHIFISVLYSMVGKSFADANNTVYVANGTAGLVPEYHVIDASIAYKFMEKYSFKVGVNNIEDKLYFNRRVTGYPGPGILPADGRSFFVSLGVKL